MKLLDAAIDDFLLACAADGLAPATIQHYKSKLGRLLSVLGRIKLSSIATNDLRLYIVGMRQQEGRYLDAPNKPAQEGGYSQETINTHIRALHRFFRWAADEYHQPNPMARIRYPQPKNSLPKGISPTLVIALLDACGDGPAGIRDRALVAFLADTGCRRAGVVGLQVHNLMLDQGRALVTEKGEKSREVKFTGFTGALLDRWLEFRPAKTSFVFVSMATEQRITGDGIAHILKRLKTKAGIDDRIYAHGFRHGFAREFILNGGDIGVLAKLMGHSNINTTAAYYAIFREDELKGMHTQFSPLRILN